MVKTWLHPTGALQWRWCAARLLGWTLHSFTFLDSLVEFNGVSAREYWDFMGIYGILMDLVWFCFSLIDFDFYIFIVDPRVELPVKPECQKVLGLAESCFTSLICGLAGSMGDPRLMGAIMAGQGQLAVFFFRCYVHKPQAIAAFFFIWSMWSFIWFVITVFEEELWALFVRCSCFHWNSCPEIRCNGSTRWAEEGKGLNMHTAQCVRNSFAFPIHAKDSGTPTQVWALKMQENPPTLQQLWQCGLPFRWSLASLASAQGCNSWEFSWWGWFLPHIRWDGSCRQWFCAAAVSTGMILDWQCSATVVYVRTPDHQKPIWLMLCVAWHVEAVLFFWLTDTALHEPKKN